LIEHLRAFAKHNQKIISTSEKKNRNSSGHFFSRELSEQFFVPLQIPILNQEILLTRLALAIRAL
jgi:hypothetical protein